MKRGTQLKLQQLKVITIAWVIMGLLMTIYDYLILRTDSSSGISGEYSFLVSAARNMGAGLLGGLIGGSLLVFYVNVKYSDKPYAYTVLVVTAIFLVIILLMTVLMGLIIVPLRTGLPLSNAVSWNRFIDFLRDSSHIKAALGWSFIVGITQLMLQVNSKFGQGDFWNIIRGRYNTPKEERRIFMFLDINSSTSIAEKLGDEAYHALLKDFFADITLPILNNKGSIYQYVGDEVVIAWKYEEGIENMHCLQCFFDLKKHIEMNSGKYMRRYGLVPSFKAGLHSGRVIAGEIGILKRDITYSGDVLNTASRILNKCSELKEELIASADLLSEICFKGNFVTRPLGAMHLKGKEKKVWLNALMPAA